MVKKRNRCYVDDNGDMICERIEISDNRKETILATATKFKNPQPRDFESEYLRNKLFLKSKSKKELIEFAAIKMIYADRYFDKGFAGWIDDKLKRKGLNS